MTKIDDIDEILRQTVAGAIRTGELLRVNHEARRIAAATGLPRHDIARELFEAGIAARINMEFGAPPGTAVSGLLTPEGLGAELRSGGFERIELQHDPLELGGGHGAEDLTGLEEDDACHQPRGEAKGVYACE